jgi:hypothetical protein
MALKNESQIIKVLKNKMYTSDYNPSFREEKVTRV